MKKKNIFFSIVFFFFAWSEELLDLEMCQKMDTISYFYRIEMLCKELQEDILDLHENEFLKKNIESCYHYCLVHLKRLCRLVALFIKHDEVHLYLRDDIEYLKEIILDVSNKAHYLEQCFCSQDYTITHYLEQCLIMLTNFKPMILEISETPADINA